MKKVIYVPACTDLNRGDQALVWESIYIVQDAFNHVPYVIDYGDDEGDRLRQSRQTKAEGFNVVRSLIDNPKRVIRKNDNALQLGFIKYFLVSFVAFFDFLRNLLVLLCPYHPIVNIVFSKEQISTFDILKESDLVVVKGGGFLHTYGAISDTYYIWFNLYYLLLAIRLKKRIVMMPNSIGPIHKGLGRRLTKFVLGRVHTLYVRESISKNYLKEIGINSTLSADLGFYCKAVTEGTPTLKSVKKKIGVTLRPYRFPENKNAGAKYLKYVESISEFCKSNQNYKYYFIVQVQGPSAHENDLIAINDVISNLTSSVDYEVVDGDYNYRQLIGIYSQLDYLIGTRFHSVIFSMLSNVPCIAIAYGGNKTFGIMNSAGLKDYVVDIANISKESIEKKFLAVLNDKDYFSQWSGFIEKSNRERSLMVKTIQDVISS